MGTRRLRYPRDFGLPVHQGHLLWNAGQVVSEYLQQHADIMVQGKDVLELGAGAGLPGIVCGILGARKVMVVMLWPVDYS